METPTTRVLLKPMGYKSHSVEVIENKTVLVYEFKRGKAHIELGSSKEVFEVIVRGNCLVVKLKED